VPGLVFKFAEFFIYFGPKLVSEECLDLDRFKTDIVNSIENYENKKLPQLRKVVATRDSFCSVIEGIEWWAYNGDVRDADGHPDNSPEYVP
jgi:hypothetical protein